MSTETSWMPIETAPKDGTFVMLYDDGYLHSPSSYLIGRYDGGYWWGQRTPSGKSLLWQRATHWQPLPAAPAAAQRQEQEGGNDDG